MAIFFTLTGREFNQFRRNTVKYGTVKKWDASKGFGFILTDDDEELFVHANDLDVTIKDKRLRVDQKVSFDVRSDIKGEKAIHVRVIR